MSVPPPLRQYIGTNPGQQFRDLYELARACGDAAYPAKALDEDAVGLDSQDVF